MRIEAQVFRSDALPLELPLYRIRPAGIHAHHFSMWLYHNEWLGIKLEALSWDLVASKLHIILGQMRAYYILIRCLQVTLTWTSISLIVNIFSFAQS